MMGIFYMYYFSLLLYEELKMNMIKKNIEKEKFKYRYECIE